MKTFFNLILFSLFVNHSYSQINIEWQKTIGGDTTDYLHSSQPTIDGGYILGGFSMSNLSGDKTENSKGGSDFWIIKTDATGNIQWQKTIGGSNYDDIRSLQQTADGGYILGGRSESDISGDKIENSKGSVDYWIVKTDPMGDIQWQKTIGGSSLDLLSSIQQTSDGGFILGGYSSSNISGDKTENSNGVNDHWIIKTDATGNIQWQKTIGGSASDLLLSLQQTADGGFIFGGPSSSNISGDKTENSNGGSDYWVVKTDAIGNIQWQKTIGGGGSDDLRSIQQTNDGGYILGGSSDSNISGDKTENSNGGSDYWIVKIDATGNIQWQNTIGGNSSDYLSKIQQTADGGYIIGGSSESNISGDKTENSNGGSDYWIVKTDSVGNIQWQTTIGGSGYEHPHSIHQTTDGGYFMGGVSDSNISGNKTENSKGDLDYWIVKLSNPNSIINNNSYHNLSLYPNPTTSELNISFNLENVSHVNMQLFNSLGQLVKTINNEKLHAGENKLNFSTGNIPPGIYHLNFSVDGNVVARKVVKM